MSKFQKGQQIRIIGDSFKSDPHMLPIGSVYTVNKVQPPLSVNEYPAVALLVMKMEGITPTDIPARVHVRVDNVVGRSYANIVFEDIEVVTGEVEATPAPKKAKAKKVIRMQEDCVADGYEAGDIFEVYVINGREYFTDNDGDRRPLDAHYHEVI